MTIRLPWSRKAGAQIRQEGSEGRVAVMGALRSGTNLVAQMLESHWPLRADFHAFGWKHAGVPVLGPSSALKYPDLPIVWVCKSPHALCVSMHRYLTSSQSGRGISLSGAPSFEAFLRQPITIWDSQLPASPRLRFANPVQYWNHLTWNLETLDPARFRAVGLNYEEIVANPNSLRRIETVLGLPPHEETQVRLPDTKMARGKFKAKAGVEPFDAASVLSQAHLNAYSPDDLAFVAREADPWLLERRGYTLP